MKKRLLSCIIVLTMLVTVVYIPVSASVGKISDKTAESFVIYQNKSEVVYEGDATVPSSSIGPLKQFQLQTFAVDTTSEDTFGVLSFKAKADANNIFNDTSSKNAGIFIAEFINGDIKKQSDIFIFDYTGYMRSWTPDVNNYGVSEGTPYEKDRWYTVAMVFKKDKTFDTYIDGQFVDNKKFRNQEFDLDITQIKLYFNVGENATFYLDDFTWSKYADDSFFAENADNKMMYAAGTDVRIKFSEIVPSIDTANVKLYEVATGKEVSGVSAAFDGEYLNVTLPSDLTAGAEYRIEMNNFVGATGRTLATDNIYFNCALGQTELGATQYIKTETFADYTNTDSNLRGGTTPNYYLPSGWHIKQRWYEQNAGVVMAQDTGDNHGTAMQVGQTVDVISGIVGAFSKPGVYLPFGEKISSGVLTISYDMKPQYLSEAGRYSGHINANLLMMVYPEAPLNLDVSNNGDSSTIQEYNPQAENTGGRPIAGIIGYDIVSAQGNIFDVNGRNANSRLFTTHKTLTMTDVESEVASAYPNAAWQKVSEDDWYTVKVEFDFDSGKITWYLDGEKKDENSALMGEFGLTSGIVGLSFGMSVSNNSALCLIDNVSVAKTAANRLGDEDGVLDQDFNSYANDGTNGTMLWDAITDDGVEAGYSPKGWSVHQIYAQSSGDLMRQYGSIIKADIGKDGTTGLKFGKQIINEKSKAEAPVFYKSFDEVYTDGVINISYDLKADKLANAGDEAILSAVAGAGGTASGWGLETSGGTLIAPRQFSLGLVTVDFSSVAAEGFVNSLPSIGSYNTIYRSSHLMGIQNGKFAAFTGPRYKIAEGGASADYESYKSIIDDVQYWAPAVYRDDVEVGTWYSIKHRVDIDNDQVTTFVNDVPVAITSFTGLYPGLDTDANKTSVAGIVLGGDENMYGSEIVIDNIVVTRQVYEADELAGGVMQVRFSDYYGDTYGTATSQTTLTDAIGISFWSADIDTPAESNFSLTEAGGSTVAFQGSFDEENGVYTMALDDYLTKDTTYTLSVSGLTANGVGVPDYTQVIRTNETGELIIEPIVIKHNGAVADGGDLAENDTVTASVRIINTSGEEQTYALSMGVYENNTLVDFDFEEVVIDGVTTKSKDLEAGFRMTSGLDSVSSARVFLWDGMTTMKPVTKFGEFTNTAYTAE